MATNKIVFTHFLERIGHALSRHGRADLSSGSDAIRNDFVRGAWASAVLDRDNIGLLWKAGQTVPDGILAFGSA